MKVLCILLLVAATQAAKLGSNKALDENGNVILDFANDLSETDATVRVVCSGGEATMTLLKTGTRAGLQAQISVGSATAPDTCRLPKTAYPATGGLEQIAGDECERQGTAAEYTWAVTVVQYYPVGATGREYVSSHQFNVVCRSDLSNPESPAAIGQPNAVNEGPASYQQDIPFTLTQVNDEGARFWELELKPENVADLRGLSFVINTLVASAGVGQTANLIENGCNRDPEGIQAAFTATATEQTIRIRMFPFQFSAAANTPITFSATVTLCQPGTNGGVCAAVKPSTDLSCVLPVVDGTGKSGKFLQRASLVGPQRARRSLNVFSVGALKVKAVQVVPVF